MNFHRAPPINPIVLMTELKRTGKFDTLRKSLLEDFIKSETGRKLDQELDSTLNDIIESTLKLEDMSSAQMQYSILDKALRQSIVSRILSTIRSNMYLGSDSFQTRVKSELTNCLTHIEAKHHEAEEKIRNEAAEKYRLANGGASSAVTSVSSGDDMELDSDMEAGEIPDETTNAIVEHITSTADPVNDNAATNEVGVDEKEEGEHVDETRLTPVATPILDTNSPFVEGALKQSSPIKEKEPEETIDRSSSTVSNETSNEAPSRRRSLRHAAMAEKKTEAATKKAKTETVPVRSKRKTANSKKSKAGGRYQKGQVVAAFVLVDDDEDEGDKADLQPKESCYRVVVEKYDAVNRLYVVSDRDPNVNADAQEMNSIMAWKVPERKIVDYKRLAAERTAESESTGNAVYCVGDHVYSLFRDDEEDGEDTSEFFQAEVVRMLKSGGIAVRFEDGDTSVAQFDEVFLHSDVAK